MDLTKNRLIKEIRSAKVAEKTYLEGAEVNGIVLKAFEEKFKSLYPNEKLPQPVENDEDKE